MGRCPDRDSAPPRQLSLPLYRGEPHPCSYLPDRIARFEYTVPEHLPSTTYQILLSRGFRRSGPIVYRPACDGCRECIPLRVPVTQFLPSRSQRRVWRRNADVSVHIEPLRISDEKARLYSNYLRVRHDGRMDDDRDDLMDSLYRPCTDTLEMVYRAAGRLLAVGIVDVLPDGWSSVYFFFDPAETRRGLGTFGALVEIAECRRRSLPYWYAGYWIAACTKMNYKAEFRPHEILVADTDWANTNWVSPADQV